MGIPRSAGPSDTAALGDGEGGGVGAVLQFAALLVHRADVDDQAHHAEEHHDDDGDDDHRGPVIVVQPPHCITAVDASVMVAEPNSGMS